MDDRINTVMGGGHKMIRGGYSGDASAGLAFTFSLICVSGMGGAAWFGISSVHMITEN